jgi:hypothetical protein
MLYYLMGIFLYMYKNTVFSAALCVVPGFHYYTTCFGLTRTISGVYVVAHKLLHCCHTDHELHIKLFLYYLLKINNFYCAQILKIRKLKIKRSCVVTLLLMLCTCLCVPVYVLVCAVKSLVHQDIYRHTPSTNKYATLRETPQHTTF